MKTAVANWFTTEVVNKFPAMKFSTCWMSTLKGLKFGLDYLLIFQIANRSS